MKTARLAIDRKASFFRTRDEDVQDQRRDDSRQHQQHQPSEIRNGDEQADVRGEEDFGLVLRVPGDHVEAAPAFKSREDSRHRFRR